MSRRLPTYLLVQRMDLSLWADSVREAALYRGGIPALLAESAR